MDFPNRKTVSSEREFSFTELKDSFFWVSLSKGMVVGFLHKKRKMKIFLFFLDFASSLLLCDQSENYFCKVLSSVMLWSVWAVIDVTIFSTIKMRSLFSAVSPNFSQRSRQGTLQPSGCRVFLLNILVSICSLKYL